MGTLTPEKFSWNMSHIKSKNTTLKRFVRPFHHCNDFQFRLHVKNLLGKLNIVLPKYKIVIDVLGCFWHRHPGCRQATTPSTNVEFWQEKFKRNVERDRKNEFALKRLGWNVIVLWEREISQKEFLATVLEKIYNSEGK